MQTAHYLFRTGRRGALFEFSMAWRDLRSSFERLGLSWSLASHDVVSRYRGSILGPFWITLSMGLMVLGIGLLYAQLFQISLREFIPFVALGIVFFGVIASMVNEGCDTFVMASSMLSQTSLPMFTFVWRTVLRNIITLAHHMVIVIGVLIFFDYWQVMNLPQAVLGLALLLVNAAWISMLASIASARFRDVPQIVTSVMQFALFMTPVFWRPEGALAGHAVLNFNPFYHMLQSVRAPLMGKEVEGLSYIVLVGLAVFGWSLAFTVFSRTRRRIVHYL